MCVCPGVQTSSSKKQIIIMRLLRSRALPAKGTPPPHHPPPSLSNSKLDRHEKEAGAAEIFWLVLTQLCVKTQSHPPPRGVPKKQWEGEGRECDLKLPLLRIAAETGRVCPVFKGIPGWNKMRESMGGHPGWVSCLITVRTWIHESTLTVSVSWGWVRCWFSSTFCYVDRRNLSYALNIFLL